MVVEDKPFANVVRQHGTFNTEF